MPTRYIICYSGASQYSCKPHALHYHGIKHILKYLHATKDDGVFFWRTTSKEYLPLTDVLPMTLWSYMALSTAIGLHAPRVGIHSHGHVFT